MSHDPAEFQLASEPAVTVENGPAGVVGSGDWFDVLDAAGNALHNMQYPLRELELPPYPAGGTCGCANLGKALSHIVAAQEAIRDLEKQLGQWCAMNESAHGFSSNKCVAWTVDVYHYGNRFPSRAAIDAAIKEGA